MSAQRAGFLERRGAALLLFGLFVAGGLVFVFAGTLTRATELEAEAAAARAEVARLESQVVAGLAEIEFIETDQYVQQAARSAGYGSEGEIPFRLPADAPSPPPVPALGGVSRAVGSEAPLDAWLRLLFGG